MYCTCYKRFFIFFKLYRRRGGVVGHCPYLFTLIIQDDQKIECRTPRLDTVMIILHGKTVTFWKKKKKSFTNIRSFKRGGRRVCTKTERKKIQTKKKNPQNRIEPEIFVAVTEQKNPCPVFIQIDYTRSVDINFGFIINVMYSCTPISRLSNPTSYYSIVIVK